MLGVNSKFTRDRLTPGPLAGNPGASQLGGRYIARNISGPAEAHQAKCQSNTQERQHFMQSEKQLNQGKSQKLKYLMGVLLPCSILFKFILVTTSNFGYVFNFCNVQYFQRSFWL